ncbi:glycosyl transferase, partial [Streptomyces sp. TRM76130]|nr:glycosyl transferase [Streptomyces sp. TRM76130]
SPHEPEGSGGVAGMVMSALSAPLYAKALIDAVLRRKSKFVVTPKGDSASPDTWFGTFRYHWYFILIFAASMAAGFVYGHAHPAMIIWAAFALLITASPMFAWRHQMRQAKRSAAQEAPVAPEPPPPPSAPAAAPAAAPAPQEPARREGPHAPQQRP